MSNTASIQFNEIEERNLILSHILNKNLSEILILGTGFKLNSAQQKLYDQIIHQRKQGYPMAYILGYKYFYGLKFKVNKFTLIPRPETESIIDIVNDYIANKNIASPLIIDIGTGSGCIAITLSKYLKNKAKIVAIDKSKPALEIAKKNAQDLSEKVTFKHSDLLSNISNIDNIDIIIANLPYIPIAHYNKLYPNLKFEPKSALTDNTENGQIIFKLINQIKSKRDSTLKPLFIVLEIDPSQSKALYDHIYNTFKNPNIQIIKDLHSLDRFIIFTI